MAGYKPKSLEELNSLYDKSINAKNEIARKAFVLGVDAEVPVADTTDEAPAQSAEADEEMLPAPEQITGIVDNFIKSFGEPVAVKKVRPAMVTAASVKPVASAKTAETKVPVKESAPVQVAQPVQADKPRLIRSSERNDLFEDYKKVMDDEDDYEYSRLKLGRRRGKKLFEKKSATAEQIQEDIQPVTEAAEPESVYEPSQQNDIAFAPQEAEAEELPSPEIPETLENIDAVIEKVLGRPLEEKSEEPVAEPAYEPSFEEFSQQSYEETEEAAQAEEETAQELPEAEEAYEEPSDEAYYEEQPSYEPVQEYIQEETEEPQETAEESEVYVEIPTETVKNKKSSGLKNILLVALLFVLLLATAVSAVKAFAGINSDNLISGAYHLYSANADYVQGGISKGDLVLVAHESVEEGENFAYKVSNGVYGFAKLDSVLNEESIVADNNGQKTIVLKNTVRGTIAKTYPSIGTFAALIASGYLYIIGGLLAVAAVLLFLILFVFRKKKTDKEADEEESYVYTEEQQGNYENVEDDFMYLIQEEPEEGFDAYRQDYSPEETEEESLPVANGDYKYEPDEYVNN